MKDANICPHCQTANRPTEPECSFCHQVLILPADGAISIWRLGENRSGLTGILARALQDQLGIPAVIQPAIIDHRPSLRPTWKGLSANVFLRQTHDRHRRGEVASLGIMEENIVPSASYNFLFGYAYLGFPAVTASLDPLASDNPPTPLLAERFVKIILHELGHSFGLDHHEYDEGIDCMMVGDSEIDCLTELDAGGLQFCTDCLRQVNRSLNIAKRAAKSRRVCGCPSASDRFPPI